MKIYLLSNIPKYLSQNFLAEVEFPRESFDWFYLLRQVDYVLRNRPVAQELSHRVGEGVAVVAEQVVAVAAELGSILWKRFGRNLRMLVEFTSL
jgi:hypothetical protein